MRQLRFTWVLAFAAAAVGAAVLGLTLHQHSSEHSCFDSTCDLCQLAAFWSPGVTATLILVSLQPQGAPLDLAETVLPQQRFFTHPFLRAPPSPVV